MWRDADPELVQQKIDAGETYTIRFKVPPGARVEIDDIVRGKVGWDAEATVGDFIILRSSGIPVYNFCVAVDDATMKISHVIRAEEHLTNTLRQVRRGNKGHGRVSARARASLRVVPVRCVCVPYVPFGRTCSACECAVPCHTMPCHTMLCRAVPRHFSTRVLGVGRSTSRISPCCAWWDCVVPAPLSPPSLSRFLSRSALLSRRFLSRGAAIE